MGIDATRKWRSEGFPREWPKELEMRTDVIERVSGRWQEYGLPEALKGSDALKRRGVLTEKHSTAGGGGKIGLIDSPGAQTEH